MNIRKLTRILSTHFSVWRNCQLKNSVTSPNHFIPSWLIVTGSAVAVAIVMGISRFSFTPLLPVMINDGIISLAQGGTLASANYFGYLLGALICIWLPRQLQSTTIIRCGMIITVLLTFGMLVKSQAAWITFRFFAGMMSALVLIHTSRWCLTILNARGETTLGSLMFTGVGGGIMLSGLAVTGMVNIGINSFGGWIIFGTMSLALSALAWRIFNVNHTDSNPKKTAESVTKVTRNSGEFQLLSLSYGIAGFGYIITATFLPVIAHAALPESDKSYLSLFWPTYGASAIVGCIIAVKCRGFSDARLALGFSYILQAVGVAGVIFYPSVPGFFISSILAGLPFNAINFYAMQEVNRLKPHHAARYMGLLTALFSVGQIAGPPLANAVMSMSESTKAGFNFALEIASCSLIVGAAIYFYMMWKWRFGS